MRVSMNNKDWKQTTMFKGQANHGKENTAMDNGLLKNLPTPTWEFITPEIAKEMLSHNFDRNRRCNQYAVDQYARDMRNGDWKINGETIGFDVDGNLINGQHRLKAIIKSGIPETILVVRGLPKDAAATIDRGQSRNTSQALYIAGVNKSTHNMVAIAKMHLIMLHSDWQHNITDSEVAKVLNRYGGEIEVANSFGGKGARATRIANNAPCKTAAFHAILCGAERERLAAFFKEVNNGCCEGRKDTAANAERLTLEQIKARYGSAATARKAIYHATCIAINDFLSFTPRQKAYSNYSANEKKNPFLAKVKAMEDEADE